MVNFWIIAGILLVAFTILLSKLTLKHYKGQNSDKMWKQFGMRTRYYQLVVLVSFGLTTLVMVALKYTNVITF